MTENFQKVGTNLQWCQSSVNGNMEMKNGWKESESVTTAFCKAVISRGVGGSGGRRRPPCYDDTGHGPAGLKIDIYTRASAAEIACCSGLWTHHRFRFIQLVALALSLFNHSLSVAILNRSHQLRLHIYCLGISQSGCFELLVFIFYGWYDIPVVVFSFSELSFEFYCWFIVLGSSARANSGSVASAASSRSASPSLCSNGLVFIYLVNRWFLICLIIFVLSCLGSGNGNLPVTGNSLIPRTPTKVNPVKWVTPWT